MTLVSKKSDPGAAFTAFQIYPLQNPFTVRNYLITQKTKPGQNWQPQ